MILFTRPVLISDRINNKKGSGIRLHVEKGNDRQHERSAGVKPESPILIFRRQATVKPRSYLTA